MLEILEGQIGVVNAALAGPAPSAIYTNNLTLLREQKTNLIGSFDSYEKYLYFESSSYETSSYGEFFPSTWPKQNNTKPYINYSTTSSEGSAWFQSMIATASQYDIDNSNALRKFIPFHIYENPANDQYILFVDMMGHYYDLIFTYIHQMTHINKRYESLMEGYAKDLVYTIAQSFGLNAENGFAIQDLWEYLLGTNTSGGFAFQSSGSLESTSKEVWKRIVTNLPYLLKTKGTARGIRALINCYGIPSSILRVREFGGPEPGWNTTSQDVYDQFFYGLRVHPGLIVGLSGVGGQATEIRFRISESILNTNSAYSIGGLITINPGANTATVNGQTKTVPLSSGQIDWWSLCLNSAGNSYLGANTFSEPLIFTFPAGGAVGSATIAGPFEGFISEFRTYSKPLERVIFQQHLMAPTSYVGPLSAGQQVGALDTYDTLKTRFPLGGDSKKVLNTTSVHPNQSVGGGSVTYGGYNAATLDLYFEPQVETHYLTVVDGGPSRQIGSKIRIDDNILQYSNQLLEDSTIQWSVQDLQPVESPRVGVYFSPNDEVNEDISEHFGGINLDSYIGAPWDYNVANYPELEVLRREYLKKYTRRNNVQGFVRLTQNYDASLFQLVKQFVAERALLHTGLVYESDVLHRVRIPTEQPSYEDLYSEGAIDLPDPEPYSENALYEGTIEDVFRLPTAGEMYDPTGIINATNQTSAGGSEESIQAVIEGAAEIDPITGEAELIEGETESGLPPFTGTQTLNDPFIMHQTLSKIYTVAEDAMNGLGNLGSMPSTNTVNFMLNQGFILPDQEYLTISVSNGILTYSYSP